MTSRTVRKILKMKNQQKNELPDKPGCDLLTNKIRTNQQKLDLVLQIDLCEFAC